MPVFKVASVYEVIKMKVLRRKELRKSQGKLQKLSRVVLPGTVNSGWRMLSVMWHLASYLWQHLQIEGDSVHLLEHSQAVTSKWQQNLDQGVKKQDRSWLSWRKEACKTLYKVGHQSELYHIAQAGLKLSVSVLCTKITCGQYHTFLVGGLIW